MNICGLSDGGFVLLLFLIVMASAGSAIGLLSLIARLFGRKQGAQ